MSKLFRFGELQFSSSSNNLLGSDGNGQVFKGTFNGRPVAVKKFSLKCANSRQDEHHWGKLAELQDEHLVQYHKCEFQDNVRYLVMELCQGSMLDYCRKTLDESVGSHVKATEIMWQITCGLDYLHRLKIDHENLKLKNVLFWKRDSKSKRVFVKLTGYGYDYHHRKDKIGITCQLGYLFYSAATKKEDRLNGPISLNDLTEIDDNRKALASDLISLLVDGSLSNSVEMGTLLRHPLFTRYSEDKGRLKLIQDSMEDKVALQWNDKGKLQKWLESVDERKFPDEEFQDLKDILLEAGNKDITKKVSDAFATTPQLFSEYIWHTAIGSGKMGDTVPEGNIKIPSIEIQEELGKGNYGKVYKCQYMDGNRNRHPAACKKCSPKPEADEVFKREIETLRKLNHLFVVKYLDVVEKNSKKFIVMELCDGSLKEYVKGKLERIPKDSLDDKVLIGQVVLGLAYIHDKGIIHKDLKLENILLKRESPRLVLAKIADFGFAKELKPGRPDFSETAHPGTDTYMAPELLNAQEGAYPATFASDVYALGITIARIVLKGEHPFSSNKTWRTISMVQGLVTPNLQGLRWDLIDLILKLTDKDPEKRPEMLLVLRHPYFVLTNGRTKRYFVDQICDGFKPLSDEDRYKLAKKIFSNRNFQEWYERISKDKPENAEEFKKMSETLLLFRSLHSGVQADTLFPLKQYEKTIMEAINSERDVNTKNKMHQMITILSFLPDFFLYRLHKVIQRAPKLFVPYLWSHLSEIFSHSKPIISEIEWSNLYLDEVVDELWNIKYSEDHEHSPETIQEMIETIGKCNISERIWSALLNRIGKDTVSALAYSAAKSHASNAPKVIEMILQRYGIIKGMEDVIHHTASNKGDWGAEMMQVVLKYGGNPNACNLHHGFTSVHHTAMNESRSGPKIMKLLLQYGGDPNAQTTYFRTPVHIATGNQGDYAAEILKLLLDSGGACDMAAEVSLLSIFGPNHFFLSDLDINDTPVSIYPIFQATMNIGESAPELLDLLIKKRGIDVTETLSGMSLIHCAIINPGDCGPKIMKKLLENGLNPNIRDKEKNTPLHYATINKYFYPNIATIAILLENGGDPNAIGEFGRTPVHVAASNEEEQALEILKLLLDHRGKLDIKDDNGLTPVHYAFLNLGICGDEIREIVGVNDQTVNVPLDTSRQTLLHRMIENVEIEYQIEHFQSVLDNGGNPNALDNLGQSPVHYIVSNNQCNVGLEVLHLLLKKGGNPNLLDKDGWTPIHYAANGVNETALEMMKILLGNGGNANACSAENGLRPLHLAVENLEIHGTQLTKMLLEYGGNPNLTDIHKRTPLHWATLNRESRLNIIKELLEKGGNPNAGDNNGMTPVHYFLRNERSNSVKVLKLLLKHGGSILQEDNSGNTPYHLATLTGCKKYCNLKVKKYYKKVR